MCVSVHTYPSFTSCKNQWTRGWSFPAHRWVTCSFHDRGTCLHLSVFRNNRKTISHTRGLYCQSCGGSWKCTATWNVVECTSAAAIPRQNSQRSTFQTNSPCLALATVVTTLLQISLAHYVPLVLRHLHAPKDEIDRNIVHDGASRTEELSGLLRDRTFRRPTFLRQTFGRKLLIGT